MCKPPQTVLSLSLLVVLVIVWMIPGGLWAQQPAPPAHSLTNMVASVHPLATQAGLRALEKGGNAVDAAIATALTLGVVDGFNSGIGGGCFILIRTADGQVIAIDGREMAPAAAHRDMYLVDGEADTTLSQRGPLAVGVPGALAAYAEAVRDFGRLSLGELVGPAADIADRGFEVGPIYAARVRSVARHLQGDAFSGTRAILLTADGAPISPTTVLRQPDLAATYRAIAKHGTKWFYQGPFAEQVSDWMARHGGILTAADFHNYSTQRRQPIKTSYRGLTIYGFPPPSSGGVHVAQILNILKNFDLHQLHQREPAAFYHALAEAMKLGFADRAYWLGDSDFVDVPTGLIRDDYAFKLFSRIDLQQTIEVPTHGTPPAAETEFFGAGPVEKHTTHIGAADAEGNWVAITTTVNTTFGSKVIVPGTGVVLNNQMDDFSIAPGVPNAFGLIGNEANAIRPGKRPLSSMSPTIVMREGQPLMTVGAAGGPKIITQVLQAIIGYFDLQKPIEQAVSAPRIHHQWRPDRLTVERSMDSRIKQELEDRGHRIHELAAAGTMQAIVFEPATKMFYGVSDPRVNGLAQGTE